MVIVDASEVKTLVKMAWHLRYGEWAFFWCRADDMMERRASPAGLVRGPLHFRVDQAQAGWFAICSIGSKSKDLEDRLLLLVGSSVAANI